MSIACLDYMISDDLGNTSQLVSELDAATQQLQASLYLLFVELLQLYIYDLFSQVDRKAKSRRERNRRNQSALPYLAELSIGSLILKPEPLVYI